MSDQSGLEQTYGERYAASLMNTFGAPKLVLTRGEGPYVWDADGRRYLDLLGGIAVNALGHGHPALVDAVTTQLSTLGHISNFFTSAPQVELAEALVRLLDADAPAKVFFTNSGTEANEAAFKLTRRTGRTRIVAAEGAFHGRTMGALALTAKAAYREPFEPLPGEVVFVPYGDAEALAAAVDGTTAAIVLEPIQGEAGVVVPPEGYLAAARRIADEHGALLWFDEIQSGMGRTGRWFAHQHPAIGGVTPDVVTLAKSLGGGFPIGALIGIGRAAELFEPGNHGTTFGGNPVACAAGLAVIGVIENAGLLERVAVLGQKIRDGLAADPRVVEVRGEGLLIGLDLVAESSAAVAAAAQDAGFIVNAPTPTRIRLAPAYVLTEDDVDAFLAAWPGVLDAAGVTA